jgi:hypothetical protein
MTLNVNEKSSLISVKNPKTYKSNDLRINYEDTDSIESITESSKSKRTYNKSSICPTCHGKYRIKIIFT